MKKEIFQMSISLDGYFEGPRSQYRLAHRGRRLQRVGLMDEVCFIITPVLLGAGHAEFGDIKKRHELKSLWTKKFESGNVVLSYAPTTR